MEHTKPSAEVGRTGLKPNIHELIGHWAEHTPDAPAILAPGKRPLSYARLHELVCTTAAHLQAMGIGRKERVAIVLPNGPEMAAAFLAVSAICACAPLNPAYRAKEFDYYLADLAPRLLLVADGAESAALEVANARAIPVLRLRTRPEAEAGIFNLVPEGAVPTQRVYFSSSDDVALLLHTSGTTSRPKLVALTQRNLCASAHNIACTFALRQQDRCLNIMPLFHIHGLVGAVLSSLSAGSTVVCTPGYVVTRLFSWLDEFLPTWYTAVPTMHQGILARAAAHSEILSRHSLRFIRSCSSPLFPKVMTDLEGVFHVPVLESYGMTEASHQIASNRLPPAKRKPGSVGLPSGPEVAIMGTDGTLLPREMTGEIVIRGETVIRAYANTPVTSQSSGPDGWFHTGDAGYLDSDGYIFITSRLKEIINRAGEKISPREIDEVLLEHPAVAQALTFAVPHSQFGEDVGAAVVLKANASADEAELRRYAATRLVDFKVPRVIRMVAELPKGPTGKPQRIGLADVLGVKPVDSAISPRAEFVAPKTSLESDLAEIWRRVLRTDEVGRDDDFFALGGDSILAAELFVAVSQAFAVKLPLAILLEAPTIATLAQRIERAAAGGGAQMGPLIPVQPQGGLPALFCVAGLDGNLLGFSRLARELGPDQPVWTFAPPYVNEARSSFTIQELALEYLEGIRVLQSQGPYYLLGNCFGGLVAYEMACQLSQQGEESLLFMLDTFNRSWSRGLPWRALMRYRLRHGVTRARFQLEKLAHLNALDRLRHLRDRSAAFLRETQLRFAQQVYQRCIENGGPLPKLARDLRCASRYAERRYVPRSFSGEAVLFRTVEPLAYAYDEAFMGWKGLLTGDVEVCDIPGEHLHSLSLPGVNVVGPQVTRYLGIYRSSRQAYSLGGATRN